MLTILIISQVVLLCIMAYFFVASKQKSLRGIPELSTTLDDDNWQTASTQDNSGFTNSGFVASLILDIEALNDDDFKRRIILAIHSQTITIHNWQFLSNAIRHNSQADTIENLLRQVHEKEFPTTSTPKQEQKSKLKWIEEQNASN